MLCPIKVNSNTVELTVHSSCYWVQTYSILIATSALQFFCGVLNADVVKYPISHILKPISFMFAFSQCQEFKGAKLEYIRKQKFLNPKTTHLIIGRVRSTEKLLSALAKGIWLLPEVAYLVRLLKYSRGQSSVREYSVNEYSPKIDMNKFGNPVPTCSWQPCRTGASAIHSIN